MINFLAVIVSALAGMLIALWWYSSQGFGTHWRKHTKTKTQHMKGTMVVAFLAQLCTALVMGIIMNAFTPDWALGMLLAIVIWVGFVAATTINDVLWDNRNTTVWAIHNGYRLISFIVMGVILALW